MIKEMRSYTIVCDSSGCQATATVLPNTELPEGWTHQTIEEMLFGATARQHYCPECSEDRTVEEHHEHARTLAQAVACDHTFTFECKSSEAYGVKCVDCGCFVLVRRTCSDSLILGLLRGHEYLY